MKKPDETRILRAKAGLEDEQYPKSDWQSDVANGDTKLGYTDWLLHNIESHKDDEEDKNEYI